jgi:hypothetical protein
MNSSSRAFTAPVNVRLRPSEINLVEFLRFFTVSANTVFTELNVALEFAETLENQHKGRSLPAPEAVTQTNKTTCCYYYIICI